MCILIFSFSCISQGARGDTVGGDMFVENIFEELDYPGTVVVIVVIIIIVVLIVCKRSRTFSPFSSTHEGEYFYNKSTGLLYLYYNGS